MATFNARAETVATKPFFRDAFKRNRCLIPMSGYYEWQDTPQGKQPWYFTADDGSPILTAAGLWNSWKNPETGQALLSCTMIITEPNALVAAVHDRMPVLLTEKQFEPWLRGEAGIEYLKPPGDDLLLQKWPVSKRVNSSKAPADDFDSHRADRDRPGLMRSKSDAAKQPPDHQFPTIEDDRQVPPRSHRSA